MVFGLWRLVLVILNCSNRQTRQKPHNVIESWLLPLTFQIFWRELKNSVDACTVEIDHLASFQKYNMRSHESDNFVGMKRSFTVFSLKCFLPYCGQTRRPMSMVILICTAVSLCERVFLVCLLVFLFYIL